MRRDVRRADMDGRVGQRGQGEATWRRWLVVIRASILVVSETNMLVVIKTNMLVVIKTDMLVVIKTNMLVVIKVILPPSQN